MNQASLINLPKVAIGSSRMLLLRRMKMIHLLESSLAFVHINHPAGLAEFCCGQSSGPDPSLHSEVRLRASLVSSPVWWFRYKGEKRRSPSVLSSDVVGFLFS